MRDGVWQTPAGKPLDFVIVGFDGAGNQKQNGGDDITVADATVKDNGLQISILLLETQAPGARM